MTTTVTIEFSEEEVRSLHQDGRDYLPRTILTKVRAALPDPDVQLVRDMADRAASVTPWRWGSVADDHEAMKAVLKLVREREAR